MSCIFANGNNQDREQMKQYCELPSSSMGYGWFIELIFDNWGLLEPFNIRQLLAHA
ncbi:hypothetical protein [Clostridium sp. YIM B02551]|uniref:hypothetical protein n=1 Tax=Clostridium sp. YIM B02551 TaxID=2910679 RepID=UPI001EEB9DD7|nr:hypothetical protein [Clostridium sp. YIM B02551]